MTIHYDPNGWPCIGKYIGLLIDSDEPIFQTPEQQEYYKSMEFQQKLLMHYLMQNTSIRNPLFGNPLPALFNSQPIIRGITL